MTNLSTITGKIGEMESALNEFISDNKTAVTATMAGVGGVALGAGTVAVVNKIRRSRSKSKRSSSRKRSSKSRKKKYHGHTLRGWKQDRKRFNKSQKWEVAYRKRKARKNKSKKGIHYTKNGQPYKIMSNGRARFIKKTKRRAR